MFPSGVGSGCLAQAEERDIIIACVLLSAPANLIKIRTWGSNAHAVCVPSQRGAAPRAAPLGPRKRRQSVCCLAKLFTVWHA